jgi:hypothetical protein
MTPERRCRPPVEPRSRIQVWGPVKIYRATSSRARIPLAAAVRADNPLTGC